MKSSQGDEEIKFPRNMRTIIATKGLPCTYKTTIARRIGDWARCPVLYIDHFLDALSIEKGFTANSRPSNEEGKRINRVAIKALWKAAARHLHKDYGSDYVVVKSSLSSSFELELLAWVAKQLGYSAKVIVIDCQMKNEHRYRLKMERRVSLSGHLEWCKASSWKDIVRAREADDCLPDDDHAWDQHIQHLTNGFNFRDHWNYGFRFVRLVVDAYEDIHIYETQNCITEIGSDFREAIRYLMTTPTYRGFVKDDEAVYQVMQFRVLRRFLLEKELQMPRERSKYLCATNGHDNCLFKYREALKIAKCGVCEERNKGQHPTYTCHFCFLTLHKSCAERRGIDYPWDPLIPEFYYPPYADQLSSHTVEHHPCKSCVERGESFSGECHSCLFQTHLKANMLPTIIHHDSHPDHFLSLQFNVENHICKACGELEYESGYACSICKFYCHIKCIFHASEILHQHGGYKHVMKLKFSHDEMDPEESYWCDNCYEDLDPQDWFYDCTDCPYYVVHTHCIGFWWYRKAAYRAQIRNV